MRNEKRFVLAGACALLTVISACASTGGSTGSGPTTNSNPAHSLGCDDLPGTVRVSVVGENDVSWAGHYAAIESGAYRKVEQRLGTKFRFTAYDSGSAGVPAFLSGDTDFILIPGAAMLTLRAKHQNVVGVVNAFRGGALPLVASTHVESANGKDLASFGDATWGYTGEGSASQVVSQIMAEKSGLKWSDVSKVALGPVSAFAPALRTGRADIIAMTASAAGQILHAKAGYLVTHTSDPAGGFPYADAVNPFVAKADYVAKCPELAAEVAAAEIAGIHAVTAVGNDPGAALKLMPPDFQQANQSFFADAWPLVLETYQGVDGTFDKQAIDQTIGYAVAQHGVSDPSTVDRSAFRSDLVTRAVKIHDLK